jgi:putative FmdB family regulatory protein
MPLYEYLCANCGKRFERIQKFSDPPLTEHPECGSGPVERLISTSALQFKGTGWYVTDYAKGGSNGSAGSDSKSSEGKTGGAKSDGSKSEGSKSESSKSESSKTESSTKSESSNSTSSPPAPAKS